MAVYLRFLYGTKKFQHLFLQETRLTTTTQAPSKVSFPSGPSRRPDNEFKDRKEQTGPTAPRLSIKKFNRFSRPDIRKV